MKVTVIYGQSHKGMTWSMTQLLLEYLEPDYVDEFMLPRDGPPSCIGCNRCFLEGEDRCPHHDRVAPIVESMLSSDVIVLASPNYVDGMTGAMKDLMDHLAYTWMSHRPNGEMFTKTAVAIVSSAGAGNRRVLSSMERQLRSWMVPKVHTIGLVSHAYSIGDLTEKKARYVDRRCFKVAPPYSQIGTRSRSPSVRGSCSPCSGGCRRVSPGTRSTGDGGRGTDGLAIGSHGSGEVRY